MSMRLSLSIQTKQSLEGTIKQYLTFQSLVPGTQTWRFQHRFVGISALCCLNVGPSSVSVDVTKSTSGEKRIYCVSKNWNQKEKCVVEITLFFSNLCNLILNVTKMPVVFQTYGQIIWRRKMFSFLCAPNMLKLSFLANYRVCLMVLPIQLFSGIAWFLSPWWHFWKWQFAQTKCIQC